MMMVFSGALTRNHRNILIGSRVKAARYCGLAVLHARKLVADNDYYTAQSAYKCALEAADILLDTDPDGPRAEARFAHAATELAYLSVAIGQADSIKRLHGRILYRFRYLNIFHNENDLLRGIDNALEATSEDLVVWLERFKPLEAVVKAEENSNVVDLQSYVRQQILQAARKDSL